MFELKNTPPITDSRAIKAFLRDKTIKWRVRDGYFETFFPGEMKILLITSEKCLILYFLNTDGSIRWVEIWDLATFTTVNLSCNMKILFFSENLGQFGIKLLDPSVRLPEFGVSHPLKLAGAMLRKDFFRKYPQLGHAWALLEISGKKYVASWSVLTRKVSLNQRQTVNYFELFLTPPVPVQFLECPPVPYYFVTRFLLEAQIHYPTKKKDRDKPKEFRLLPTLEEIYGYHLIDRELKDHSSILEVVPLLEASWQARTVP